MHTFADADAAIPRSALADLCWPANDVQALRASEVERSMQLTREVLSATLLERMMRERC